MSRASKHIPVEKPADYSKKGSKEAIAEPTEWPGQKPCYSEANDRCKAGRSRRTKIFIRMRYQMEVTKMGQRLAGRAVSQSGLGMAVSKVVRKSGAIPSTRTAYSVAVTSAAKSGTRIKTYKTPTARPKTPGAV